jgi:(2Fe-2S) ferredoxin
MRFEKHIFICTNERPAGGKKSCGEACGLELVKEFKQALKEKNLHTKVRAQKSGCLDACEYGPSMVVYPEGVFYGGISKDDIPEIIEKHIVGNKPVERLVINFEKIPNG